MGRVLIFDDNPLLSMVSSLSKFLNLLKRIELQKDISASAVLTLPV
jgi:hypothetical protein